MSASRRINRRWAAPKDAPNRRDTPPFTPFEAFRKVRRLWKKDGPCPFACGSCLMCRIHERVVRFLKRRGTVSPHGV